MTIPRYIRSALDTTSTASLRVKPVVAHSFSLRRFFHDPPSTVNQIQLLGKLYTTDSWTNIPSSIIRHLSRRLHLQPSHPISLTRELIISRFSSPLYIHYNDYSPIVSVNQNFDSLGFPLDHPGRSKTDTYYVNANTCLRTHSSAHQAETFRRNSSNGYTISADVYRRDAIDRSHYPVFHQMEGGRVWSRHANGVGKLRESVWADVQELPSHNLLVDDAHPTYHKVSNPLQQSHSPHEVEVLATHLKRTLEDVVVTIFDAAQASIKVQESKKRLHIRWVEANFPFTSPSWELEVYWQGQWLEVLGCGIVQQSILNNAGMPGNIGWAFGLGIERIAMLLFDIPDIRLFWSEDERFLSQFKTSSPVTKFVPFSKYPPCWKDVSFWLPGAVGVKSSGADAAEGWNSTTPFNVRGPFHENDMMELVREIAGDLVEDVKLVDEFEHPKTKRKSLCYRINYRSLERTLQNEEVNHLHELVRLTIRDKVGIELR